MMLEDTTTDTLQETRVTPAPSDPGSLLPEARPESADSPQLPAPAAEDGTETLTATRTAPPATQDTPPVPLPPASPAAPEPPAPASEPTLPDLPDTSTLTQTQVFSADAEEDGGIPALEPPSANAPADTPDEGIAMPQATPRPMDFLRQPASADLQEKAAFWDSVLTGDPHTVPEPVRRQAGCMDPSLPDDVQDYLLTQTINQSWAVDHLDLPREEVRAHWDRHRRSLAIRLHAANNDTEVFCALSIHHKDATRRAAARHIYESAYRDGLLGNDYEEDTEAFAMLAPEERGSADVLGIRSYQEGADLRARWLPLAERTADAIDAFSTMDERALTSPMAFSGVPNLLATVDELCYLEEDDLMLVTYLAVDISRKRHPKDEDESTISRFGRAVNRGAINLLLNIDQTVENMSIATLSNFGRKIGGKSGRIMRREAINWDRRTSMVHRLRTISQQEIHPLYPADRANEVESYFIDAAEALPSAILSLTGGCGFATLTFSGIGQSVADARLRAPQGDQELQYAAGITAGLLQAAIYSSVSRLGGRLLENSLSNFARARGAGGAAFAMSGCKTAGALSVHALELWAAGKLSQAADLGTQEAAARLSGTASNIDWKSFGDSILDIDTNMHEAASLLPFLLIASGSLSLRHFKDPHSMFSNKEYLARLGIDDSVIERMQKAPDIDSRNAILRESILSGPFWNEENLPAMQRSLALLNSDYFRVFNNPEAARDFLRLPAEARHIQRPALPEPTMEEMRTNPPYGNHYTHLVNRTDPRVKESLDLWYSWLWKAHYTVGTGPFFRDFLPPGLRDTPGNRRIASYRSILNDPHSLLPESVRNTSYVVPGTEMQRRHLLRDTISDVQDLSYQYLMWAFTPDSLIRNTFPPYRIAKQAERTRQQVLGQVSRTVMAIALGTPIPVALEEFGRYVGWYFVRRGHRGSIPRWLLETPYKKLMSMPERLAEYYNSDLFKSVEPREALRVIGGLSACIPRLCELLPLTADFSTALSRGMTPAQAYHHLLQREFGFDPEMVFNYPMGEIKKTANISNMELFGNEARNCYNNLRTLTGASVEQVSAEGGRRYWRLFQPDGQYTRWHHSEQDALNDAALRMAPYFAPIGADYYKWMRFFHPRKGFDLAGRPTASYKDFCGFDQVNGIALTDLKNHLFRSATRVQPGFFLERRRKRLGGHRSLSPVRVQMSEGQSADSDGVTVVDSLSTLTPYMLMNARFRVFWKRMLDSRRIEAAEVMDFLQSRGQLTAERRTELEEMARPLPFPKNPNVPLCLTPPPNIGGRNRILSDIMADYHTDYYFADLPSHNIPPSVHRWFSMVPFCPAMPPEHYVSPVTRYVSLRIPYGPGGRTALAWSNRYTAMLLNQNAGKFEALRRDMARNPLPANIDEMFRLSEGESPAQRYEQAWGHYYGGNGVFVSTPQYLWNLLQSPRRGWFAMPEHERNDLRRRIHYLAMTDPSLAALDAAGRGEGVDYVEQSILSLDSVLQRHPELHGYSPTPDLSGSIMAVRLNDELPPDSFMEAPSTELFTLDLDDSIVGDNIEVRNAQLPEDLQADPEVMQALRFMHTLRSTCANRPYLNGSHIWWDGAVYGGRNGKRPAGLQDWEEYPPLANLFQLVNNIHEINARTGSPTMDICGVPVRGASWTLEDFPQLSSVSVYRWPLHRARVYRLMPGFPQSNSVDVRTPYLVQSNHGLYTTYDHTTIHSADDLYRSYTPLELYTPKRYQAGGTEIRDNWRRETIQHTLDAISLWPTDGERLMEDPYSGVHGVSELLLRLCEDTGFNYMIDPRNPDHLSREEAHIVNIATALMESMQSTKASAHHTRLRQAMRPLQEAPDQRTAVLETLFTYNDVVGKNEDAEHIFRSGFATDIREAMQPSADMADSLPLFEIGELGAEPTPGTPAGPEFALRADPFHPHRRSFGKHKKWHRAPSPQGMMLHLDQEAPHQPEAPTGSQGSGPDFQLTADPAPQKPRAKYTPPATRKKRNDSPPDTPFLPFTN